MSPTRGIACQAGSSQPDQGAAAPAPVGGPNRAAFALAGTVLAAPALFAVWPVRLIACPFHALTGLPCPFCGLTRSIAALWQLDLQHSLRCHPLGIPLAMVAVYTLARAFRPRLPILRAGRLAAGAFAVVWIARLLLLSAGSTLLARV